MQKASYVYPNCPGEPFYEANRKKGTRFAIWIREIHPEIPIDPSRLTMEFLRPLLLKRDVDSHGMKKTEMVHSLISALVQEHGYEFETEINRSDYSWANRERPPPTSRNGSRASSRGSSRASSDDEASFDLVQFPFGPFHQSTSF